MTGSGSRTVRAKNLAPPRFGLFVEGAHTSSLHDRDALVRLWRALCEGFGVEEGRVDVHGFSKAHILAMRPLPPGVRLTTRQPLDTLVDIEHRKRSFDVLVVAFDAHPANQDLLPHSCLRTEVNFVLKGFASSTVLPSRFRQEAEALLTRYERSPKTPRGPGRPPRGPLDTIYMDPMFEALVLADPAAWRDIFGLDRFPKDWPSVKRSDRQLDQVMARMVQAARRTKSATLPKHLGWDVKANKHAFALEALRHAGATSPIWRHPIATRLAEVLA